MLYLCLFLAQPAQAAQTSPLPIGTIQGAGPNSPYVDQIVSFRAVVTGFYADQNTAGVTYYTMFVQDLPGHEDGDPQTSDGIAVFLGRRRGNLQIGDQLFITGRVTEFFGFTEIDDQGLKTAVERTAVPLPDPVLIQPPTDNEAQAAYFERIEGMRGRIDGPAPVVGPTFSGCGFAITTAVANSPTIRQSAQTPIGHIVPILHNNDADCSGFPFVKTGDLVDGLVGPIIYHFDQFKLIQQDPTALSVTAVELPPPPAPPVLQTNQFSLASFNMENHFDDVDNTGHEAEPKPSLAAIAAKEEKIAQQIVQFLGCPTFLAVQEVENVAMLQNLSQRLAPLCGFRYDISHHESADIRGIDVALLTDPERVTVQDSRLQQTCTAVATGISDPQISCPPGQQPLFSRQPLQVHALIDGQPLIVLVNHFKSKRGGDSESMPQRLAQAQHINQLVEELFATDPTTAVLVVGDFNDYELSPPLLEMSQNGRLHNLLGQIPLEQRYSFVFAGAAQLIDGILVSPALAEQLVAVTIQHVNADFPSNLAEDLASPYRATDHDLPLALFELPSARPLPGPPPRSWGWLWVVALLLIGGTAVYLYRRR